MPATYLEEFSITDTSTMHYFCLCEICFWSATILGSAVRNRRIERCFNCFSEQISLIPLGNDENYNIQFDSRRGLEIEFSTAKAGSRK